MDLRTKRDPSHQARIPGRYALWSGKNRVRRSGSALGIACSQACRSLRAGTVLKACATNDSPIKIRCLVPNRASIGPHGRSGRYRNTGVGIDIARTGLLKAGERCFGADICSSRTHSCLPRLGVGWQRTRRCQHSLQDAAKGEPSLKDITAIFQSDRC